METIKRNIEQSNVETENCLKLVACRMSDRYQVLLDVSLKQIKTCHNVPVYCGMLKKLSS